MKQCDTSLCLWIILSLAIPAAARGETNDVFKRWDGTWLAERADCDFSSSLFSAWNSLFIIKDGSFTITHFCGTKKDLTGTLKPVPGMDHAIDLDVDAIDLSERWQGVLYPKCTLPAIYNEDGGRLVICFQKGTDRSRPREFTSTNSKTIVLTLARANEEFTFPKDISVTVKDEEAHPVRDANVFTFMSFMPFGNGDKPAQWVYNDAGKTNADGVATIPYKDLSTHPIAARDVQRKRIGFAEASPAQLQNGTATVVLHRECHIHGTIRSKEMLEAGKKIQWTNVYLVYGGQRIGTCMSTSGTFDFFAPPGNYTLYAYGGDLPARNVQITVPATATDFEVPSIELGASRLAMLEGKPAPELAGIEAWRGQPVKLADLKGQYVLIDFWGYWCGSCVHDMPVLMKLHERFKDKGLSVVGVHVDMEGEIDTVAKLEEKLAGIRPKFWNGQDIAFPVALISGKALDLANGEHQRGGAAAQYGILSYPTTVLLDREGKVVGEFHFSDENTAIQQVEKLLAR